MTTSICPNVGNPDYLVEYYHYGESINDLTALANRFADRHFVSTGNVLASSQSRCLPAPRQEALFDILGFLTGPKVKRLSLRRLDCALAQSGIWRHHFRRLACRGFSFRFSASPRFRHCWIRPENDLKFALLTDAGLYYPPRVRQALSRVSRLDQHAYQAIGWILGQQRQRDGQTWWFLTNIQSDLMSCQVSCVREIFRGWQRVLFWILINWARSQGIAMIAVPSAEDLDSGAGGKRRDAWRPLYDGVASFFALERQQNLTPINVQPMEFLPEMWCSRFYVGEIDALCQRFACATDDGNDIHSPGVFVGSRLS